MMRKNNKGIGFITIVVIIAVLGAFAYFSIQSYYQWSEGFNAQEAIDHLKLTKNQVEVCLGTKISQKGINDCLVHIEDSNTIHFNCCAMENNSEGNEKISYLIYATRNQKNLFVKDEGGEQPACGHESKARLRDQSGAVLCRYFDGKTSIHGWGIYQGNYN